MEPFRDVLKPSLIMMVVRWVLRVRTAKFSTSLISFPPLPSARASVLQVDGPQSLCDRLAALP
jgi:hypothetical protein